MQMNAFLTNALVFSFGADFRRGVMRNYYLIAFIVIMWVVQMLFMFLPPNSLTMVMHVFTQQFNALDTDNPVWQAWLEIPGNEPSPAMTVVQRYVIYLYQWGA